MAHENVCSYAWKTVLNVCAVTFSFSVGHMEELSMPLDHGWTIGEDLSMPVVHGWTIDGGGEMSKLSERRAYNKFCEEFF